MKSPQQDINARAAEIERLQKSLAVLTTAFVVAAALFALTMILSLIIARSVMSLSLGLPDVLAQATALAAM